MIDKVKEALYGKSLAYKRLFNPKNKDVIEVLKDLEVFCCVERPTYTNSGGNIDPLAMAAREGRREVYLRIQKFVEIDLLKITKETDERDY